MGAYSANKQAEAANKPKKGYTDQTTTRDPYAPTVDHLNKILEEQARLYEQGPPDYSKALRGGGGGGVGKRGEEAMDLYRQIGERGLDAGSTEGVEFGMDAIGDVWGAGTGGPGAGTGFEGYNPILANLAGELGDSSMDVPMELLMQFLGENDRALGGDGPARAAGEAEGGAPERGTGHVLRRGTTGSAGLVGGGGGGMVPDTGAGGGTFQRELDRIFSEEANEEEIAAVLESMAGDIEREGARTVSDLEARAMGSGRFGGSWHAGRVTDAKRAQAEELAQVSAQLRYGDLNERRQARLRALEILNSRDVAAMSDATQRAGISASAGSAAAGRDLARELAEMENARALRGQDLSAIGSIMQGEQFGLSGLMGLGERLSGDRLGALSLVPEFESLGLAGLDRALGAAGGMSGLESIDASARARGAANRREAAMLQIGAPQKMLNDYLNTVGIIGGMGGTSHTEGTNVQPGAGISTSGATWQGALGGGLAGYGMANQYGGGGGGGASARNPGHVTQSYDSYYG